MEHIMMTAADLLVAGKRSAAAKKAADTMKVKAATAQANAMWAGPCESFAETSHRLDSSVEEDEK
jgi:hypothetical protein